MNNESNLPHELICRAFPGIPDAEAKEMVAIGKVRSYSAGAVLCRENAVEDTFYVILAGEVDVTKIINDETDRFLKRLEKGDFFGEMGLIHNTSRVATVTTIIPTKVLEIHKTAFDSLLQKNSSVSLAMVREVSRRLRENDEMAIEDLRLKAGELAAAYQRLAQEELARREFLTTIAHELRTPLTSASGFLEIARKRELDEETARMALSTVSRNVERIISLVNDILLLQEVELVMPEMHPTDMGDVIASALDDYRQRVKQSKVRLHLDIAPNLPQVLGHKKSLERAVVKLLDNAIKFSLDGGDVYISVERDNTGVRLSIRDQGVGISEQILPKIFDRFYHLDEVGNELFDGLGLGLAITKQIIEQHNGKIEAESKLGEGSIFTIYLDAMEAE
ncbi:MAG: ATP-binding protein [Chloroflexota bacterium]|nr:ATP-binding protein [Chloroflexota bacterium]